MKREVFIISLLTNVGHLIVENKNVASKYNYDKGYLADSDLVAHDYLKNNISKIFPNDDIVSEEDDAVLQEINFKSEFTWLLDPICGTTNFLYNFPFYSHSVTIFKNGSPFAAGVYDPIRKEMFYSFDNKFYINGSLYKIEKKRRLNESLISINTNQSNYQKKNSLGNTLSKLSPPITRRTKILESANLELAYIACGRLDAYFNPSDKPWDIAAALLIIPSAGGSVKILNNNNNFFEQTGIIAASSLSLLKEIADKLG